MQQVGYNYDILPESFLVKVIYVLGDEMLSIQDYWNEISEKFKRKKGLFLLGNRHEPFENIQTYLFKAKTEDALELIEFIFNNIESRWTDIPEYTSFHGVKYHTLKVIDPPKLVSQLNSHFQEYNLGYQYINGKIVRRDDEFTYHEVIEPALRLLLNHEFNGAAEEFSNAHEHYRFGRIKECIVECNKAFESTMKSVCHIHKWKYESTATARALIDVLIKNNLVKPDQASFLGGIRTLFESGLPTLRNKNGAHGQGIDIQRLPKYYAQYALNITAANILFLVHASEAVNN